MPLHNHARWLPLVLMLMTACRGDPRDARLLGTWQSNQPESVAAALKFDPVWASSSPEALERFTNNFGYLKLTYAEDSMTVRMRDTEKTFKYRVVKRGDDYVVIRTQGAVEDGQDIRLRFVDGGEGYWVDTGLGYSEKFDKVPTP